MTNFNLLAPWIRDWIACEQTLNSRVSHPGLQHRFALDERDLHRQYWPESQSVFPLDYVLMDHADVMNLGPVQAFLSDHFGMTAPVGKTILFVHPGNTAIKRKLLRRGHDLHTSDILATPTSSFRSLLCWHPDHPHTPAIVKLALHVPISGVRRFIGEIELLGSLYTSRLMAHISSENQAIMGFDFFADVAGSHYKELNLGQIFRKLPAIPHPEARLVPAFSFGSDLDGAPYLRQLTASAEEAASLVENMIERYVIATSFLMFYEGISHEFHPQNVLFEIQDKRVTRVILRDFYRSTVHPALRERNQRPMPPWEADALSTHRRARYLFCGMAKKAPTAYLRVYGIRGVVWELARAMRLATGQQCRQPIQARYLRYWQEACAVWLGVWPKRVSPGPSLALNKAIAMYLSDNISRPDKHP